MTSETDKPDVEKVRYRVIERISVGGTGATTELYRAEAEGVGGFKRQVAIRRLLPHLSEQKEVVQGFLEEARLRGGLAHPHIVQVLDMGVADNACFMVMEYVDGVTLEAVSEWLRQAGKPCPVQLAVYILIKLCEGLSYAHERIDEAGRPRGIIHQDLSPSTILLSRSGDVKLDGLLQARGSTPLEQTRPGALKGQRSYLSPEVVGGKEPDLRRDIFAAGVVLWELLAGRKLFQGETDRDTARQVQQAVVPGLAAINPLVDARLEAIVARALARDPADRFGSARELGRALNGWLFGAGQPVSAFELAEFVQQVIEAPRAGPPAGEAIDDIIAQMLREP